MTVQHAPSPQQSYAEKRGPLEVLKDYMMTTDHSRPTASSGSRLLRNLGPANPGHFEDVTQSAGLNVYRSALAVTNPPNAYRFQPQFSDLDRDGLAHDFPPRDAEAGGGSDVLTA